MFLIFLLVFFLELWYLVLGRKFDRKFYSICNIMVFFVWCNGDCLFWRRDVIIILRVIGYLVVWKISLGGWKVGSFVCSGCFLFF